MACERGVLVAPVDGWVPEGEPAEAAAQGDVGERVALAVTPGPFAQITSEQRNPAGYLAELFCAPRGALLPLRAQRLVTREESRVEDPVGERLPAPYRDARPFVRRDQARDRGGVVEKFYDDPRIEERGARSEERRVGKECRL